MDSIRDIWTKAMEMPEARWIIAIFGLATCIAIAVYFGKLFRDMALGNSAETSSNHLEEFHRLKMEGKLAPEEFEKLKGAIPEHLDSDLKKAGLSLAELEQLKSKKTIAENSMVDENDTPNFVEADNDNDTDQSD